MPGEQAAPLPPPMGTDHQPLRVAWLGHGDGRRADGLSTYSREVVAALRARGVSVRFFLHRNDGVDADDRASVSLRAGRIRAMTVPLPGSLQRVSVELAAFRPHILHCSWSFSLLDGRIAAAARDHGAATVATFHLPWAPRRSIRGRMLQLLYRWHRHNLDAYDRVIALAEDQRILLASVGYPVERIAVVHNAVDTDAISPGPSALRERLGARLVVVYLGRLDPEKRVPALIQSFLARHWPPDHVLLIAGAGTQERRVRRLAEGHPEVRVLGMITSARERLDLLRAADVFVLPSTAEGLALSLLEAMAAGCAVIATDVGEDGNAVTGAGITLPARPLEPHLGRALERLRADPALRVELGRSARRRVVEAYALSTHVDRLLELYRELATGRWAA